jgi:hypothetical protein
MARSLVRVGVRARERDVALIRALAKALRVQANESAALRSALANALANSDVKTAFDVFGSDLPDEAFAGVFDQPRPSA